MFIALGWFVLVATVLAYFDLVVVIVLFGLYFILCYDFAVIACLLYCFIVVYYDFPFGWLLCCLLCCCLFYCYLLVGWCCFGTPLWGINSVGDTFVLLLECKLLAWLGFDFCLLVIACVVCLLCLVFACLSMVFTGWLWFGLFCICFVMRVLFCCYNWFFLCIDSVVYLVTWVVCFVKIYTYLLVTWFGFVV